MLRTKDAQTQAAPDLSAPISELDGRLRYADLHATDRVALDLPNDIETRSVRLTGGMSGFDWRSTSAHMDSTNRSRSEPGPTTRQRTVPVGQSKLGPGSS